MREKKPAVTVEGASEELERRTRYLTSLVQRTKIQEENPTAEDPTEEGIAGSKIEEKKEKEKEEEDLAAPPENVRVRAADMAPAMQRRAFKCAREVLAAMPAKLDSKRLALALKKEFDTTYGPAWHCIVGTSFGSYVTHSLGGFLYFSLDKVYILLFRTAVEPLDH